MELDFFGSFLLLVVFGWLVWGGGLAFSCIFLWFSLVVVFLCVCFEVFLNIILILGWEGLFGLGFCFSWFVYLFVFSLLHHF